MQCKYKQGMSDEPSGRTYMLYDGYGLISSQHSALYKHESRMPLLFQDISFCSLLTNPLLIVLFTDCASALVDRLIVRHQIKLHSIAQPQKLAYF